ncbi:MAG TPA: hypothetical protein VGR37_20100 [Longimicrobiaceae bacterium]|nr:hypothetical protein [Longimicrobiaceae bacterium]
MNLELRHVLPECTGSWVCRGTYWRCDVCGWIYYDSLEVAAALAAEVAAGQLLHQLAEEGATER